MKDKKTSKGVAGSGLTQKELTELKKKSPRRFEKIIEMIEKKKSSKGKGAFLGGGGQADILLLTPEMLEAETTAPMKETVPGAKAGGLMEATAKLKAKGFEVGGMVVKDKVVAIDKSPNSGLITVKGFGASRRT